MAAGSRVRRSKPSNRRKLLRRGELGLLLGGPKPFQDRQQSLASVRRNRPAAAFLRSHAELRDGGVRANPNQSWGRTEKGRRESHRAQPRSTRMRRNHVAGNRKSKAGGEGGGEQAKMERMGREGEVCVVRIGEGEANREKAKKGKKKATMGATEIEKTHIQWQYSFDQHWSNHHSDSKSELRQQNAISRKRGK